MENKKKKNLEAVPQNRRSANPSFSSTLLESIYRSIDEKGCIESQEEEIIMSTNSFYHSLKKHNFSNNAAAAAAVLSNSNSNSSSTSSESSFWSGGLSSSDSESAHYYYYGSSKSRSSSSSCYSSMQRPKPIRTERSSSYGPSKNTHEQQHKAKMMSKALKIYNELKKQPVSPGGKLSSFLNSLFAHSKKKKKPKNKPELSINSKSTSSSYTPAANCSSASSYTRSCLSKTPCSKLSNNGSKRSVRFFPVSIIVDEDSQPCGHKNLLLHEENDDELRVMEENWKVAEAAKKLLEKPKKESYGDDDSELDDDDDDGMSCASSDLFELNNLSGRYSEELPVYETTYVDTNRAIANGLIM